MIIITGATGFIGSNIVAELNDAGRTDLLLVDDLGSAGKWKNIAKRRFQDLVLPAEMASVLEKLSGADFVYHMGANSSTTAVDGDEMLLNNFRTSTRLWDWCCRTHTPLIYASSAATYGDGALGFKDADSLEALDRLRPLNLYGWSKHAFDKWAVERSLGGMAPPHWYGVKFFNVYGPNENHKGDMRSLVSKNTARIAAGEVVELFKSHRDGYADGRQLRDFVYVKDCTRVMLWLAGASAASGIYNLGSGSPRSFVDLVEAIWAALGKPVHIEFVDMPQSIRANYQYFTAADMAKLHAAGYAGPFHSLESGVADYVTRYLIQPDMFR